MELLGQINSLRVALGKCLNRILEDGEKLDKIQTFTHKPYTNINDAENFISKLMIEDK